MAAQTVRWLIFLALLKDFSHGQVSTFTLDTGPLTATEGSCVEIKCSVSNLAVNDDEHWFWIKDAQYNNSKSNFDGTVIYSYGNNKRAVSPMYSDRVNYTGSPSQDWSDYSNRILCNILICDLTKSDSGTYKVRFAGNALAKRLWLTEPGVTLTVKENLCPITFEKPPVLKESDEISINCSTLSTCPSDLIIDGQKDSTKPLDPEGKRKGINISLNVTWMDHGREFSCQTRGNKEKYLIQNITLTVEYAPIEVSATITKIHPTNRDMVKEGDSFTLTCTAKGHPDPTFTWAKNGQTQAHSGAEWRFDSAKVSDDGEYYCEATNKLKTTQSNTVIIDVNYAPEVEVKTSSASIEEGNTMTLTCHVKRSKPTPPSYSWFKNTQRILSYSSTGTYVKRVTPEDAGSYKCEASNQVGTRTSKPLQIKVLYRPRKTKISVNENEVRVDTALTFTCSASAHPDPFRYSWYRYSTVGPAESSWQTYFSFDHNVLHIERVQRTDEACYMCNATNRIGTGDNSEALCIQVLYPPTTPTLTMEHLVEEGQTITIICRVESFPPSVLTLTRTSASGSQTSLITRSDTDWHPNNLQHRFNVTASDRGSYTCKARNNIGPEQSVKQELLVKYRPIEVTVRANPHVIVNENTVLKLHCYADSYPRLTSVTWMKMRGEKSEKIQETQTLTFQHVSPSDSGWYRCAATNEMGTGQSQPEEIKVRYAPKYTKITRGTEIEWPNGKSAVTLSCSSQCYPPATQFTWYKKAEPRDILLLTSQTYTVSSDEPGDYYCIAKNEINQKSSDLIPVYFDRGLKKIIIIVSVVLLIFIIVIFFIYRHKQNKTVHQGQTNQQFVMDSLSRWIVMRRSNFTSEQPFRSRDDLLTDQPCHSNGQRRQQPHPDSTPANNTRTVYCTVNHPARQQGPSGEMPIKQKAGHKQDESLTYASLDFGKKQNIKQETEVDAVYAKVSKKKQAKKNEEKLEDYENIETAQAAKFPNPLDYDSDTSEDDMELNYSQVSYTPKSGHQRANRDSSSSDAEETQYSEVKI